MSAELPDPTLAFRRCYLSEIELSLGAPSLAERNGATASMALHSHSTLVWIAGLRMKVVVE